MPINVLIVRAIMSFYLYYGDSFLIEFPTGSGVQMTLFLVAQALAGRLAGTFLEGIDGRRPVFGDSSQFQTDPNWHDCLLFYEYFHGDTGTGIGASHQTGWTGTVAKLIQLFGYLKAEDILSRSDFLRDVSQSG